MSSRTQRFYSNEVVIASTDRTYFHADRTFKFPWSTGERYHADVWGTRLPFPLLWFNRHIPANALNVHMPPHFVVMFSCVGPLDLWVQFWSPWKCCYLVFTQASFTRIGIFWNPQIFFPDKASVHIVPIGDFGSESGCFPIRSPE